MFNSLYGYTFIWSPNCYLSDSLYLVGMVSNVYNIIACISVTFKNKIWVGAPTHMYSKANQ